MQPLDENRPSADSVVPEPTSPAHATREMTFLAPDAVAEIRWAVRLGDAARSSRDASARPEAAAAAVGPTAHAPGRPLPPRRPPRPWRGLRR